MEVFTLLLFALALNLDALGTGMSYGMRGIKLPIASVLIISGMSMAAVVLSMGAGKVVSSLVSPVFAQRLGGTLLLLVGLWVLAQSLLERKREPEEEEDSPKRIMQIRIRTLGLVVQVMREPHRADLDSSGTISSREALLLGTALAMDALAAGMAVSMLGFSIWSTALVVGLGHVALTYLGLYSGTCLCSRSFARQVAALPGCILIALGLLKMH